MAAFGKAFAAARAAGKKTFDWNGKSYTTKLKTEVGGRDHSTTQVPQQAARNVASTAAGMGKGKSTFEIAIGPTSPETAIPRPRPDTTASITAPTSKVTEPPPLVKHPPNATVATRPAGESSMPYTENRTPNPAAAQIAQSDADAATKAADMARFQANRDELVKKFPKAGFTSSRNRYAGR
jgi:hypothetical protein